MVAVLYIDLKTPPLTWKKFVETYPPFSVAIDGFVSGPPQFDFKGCRFNFNHHEGVPRLQMHATCGQIYIATRTNWLDSFNDGEGFSGTVYGNHSDEDTSLSFFLLKYCHTPKIIESPILERLVNKVDLLDTTGFFCKISPDDKELEKIVWIFSPYRKFKLSGEMGKRQQDAFSRVVYEIGDNILAHLAGRGSSLPVDTRYEKTEGGPGWFFIKEIGAQARMGVYNDGIKAFVTVVERFDGNRNYTFECAETSGFDVGKIEKHLNDIEGIKETDNDRWGGTTHRKGSPRVRGSRLSPQELADAINSVI
jgi:hypothetical protein